MVSVDLCFEPIILESNKGIVHPVAASIVVAKCAQHSIFTCIYLLLGNTQRNVCGSLKNWASSPHGAQRIQIISHLDSHVLGWDFLAIMPDVEGDVLQGDVGPEVVRKSRRAWRVMGVLCPSRASPSSSAQRLSSTVSSSSDAYLHHGPHFARVLCSFFGCLKRNGFLTISAGSCCVDSSEDVVDEDRTSARKVDHDVGAPWWGNREWVALALVNGLVTGPALGSVSGASEVEVAKRTRVIPVGTTSFKAVTVFASAGVAMTVGGGSVSAAHEPEPSQS